MFGSTTQLLQRFKQLFPWILSNLRFRLQEGVLLELMFLKYVPDKFMQMIYLEDVSGVVPRRRVY